MQKSHSIALHILEMKYLKWGGERGSEDCKMYTSWTFRIDVGKRAATVDGKAIFVRHVDLVTELKLNSVSV